MTISVISRMWLRRTLSTCWVHRRGLYTHHRQRCNAIFGHVARLPDNIPAHQAMPSRAIGWLTDGRTLNPFIDPAPHMQTASIKPHCLKRDPERRFLKLWWCVGRQHFFWSIFQRFLSKPHSPQFRGCVLQTLCWTALIRCNSQSYSCLKYRHTHTQHAGKQHYAAAASQRGANIMTGWTAEAGRLFTPPPAAVLLPTEL